MDSGLDVGGGGGGEPAPGSPPAAGAGPGAALDPFFLVRDEVTARLLAARREQDFLRREAKDERSDSGAADAALRSLQREIEGAEFCIDELHAAMRKVAQDPARFKLDPHEVESRQGFVTDSRKECEELRAFMEETAADQAAAASAAAQRRAEAKRRSAEAGHRNGGKAGGAASAGAGNGDLEEGAAYADEQMQHQQRLIERQDDQLDDLHAAVSRVGQMGRTIGEELGSQAEMLNDLDSHMDSTQARMRSATKKIKKLIEKSRGCQLGIIVFLLVILILLMVLISS